ncbi:hypothetical protein ACWKX9_26895 [Enterobacter asburiae]
METKSTLSCPALSSPRQMSVMPDGGGLPAMNAAQRAKVIMTLADMMIQAASMTVTAERGNDDE